MHRAVGLGRDM